MNFDIKDMTYEPITPKMKGKTTRHLGKQPSLSTIRHSLQKSGDSLAQKQSIGRIILQKQIETKVNTFHNAGQGQQLMIMPNKQRLFGGRNTGQRNTDLQIPAELAALTSYGQTKWRSPRHGPGALRLINKNLTFQLPTTLEQGLPQDDEPTISNRLTNSIRNNQPEPLRMSYNSQTEGRLHTNEEANCRLVGFAQHGNSTQNQSVQETYFSHDNHQQLNIFTTGTVGPATVKRRRGDTVPKRH